MTAGKDEGVSTMDGLEIIKKRRSIRDFSDKEISDEILHKILDAGMSGPSCVNAKDWSFIVIRDKEKLEQVAEANGKPAEPLKNAKIGRASCRERV